MGIDSNAPGFPVPVDFIGLPPKLMATEGDQWVPSRDKPVMTSDLVGPVKHSEGHLNEEASHRQECWGCYLDHNIKQGYQHLRIIADALNIVSEAKFGGTPARMVRSEAYKYLLHQWGSYREQLFDIGNDPGERINLAVEKRYSDVLNQHRKYLAEWVKLTGDCRSGKSSHPGWAEILGLRCGE